MKNVLSSLFLFILALSGQAAQLLPASRLTDWTPGVRVGVPGGIDQYITGASKRGVAGGHITIDVTQAPYNADNTGATSALSALSAAIGAATAGDLVYIPAGTYLVNGQLNISHAQDDITVRGAGMGATILKGAAITSGATDSGLISAVPGIAVTAGLSKDSTSITLADASSISVGQLIMMSFGDQDDDAAIMAGDTPTLVCGHGSQTYGVRRQITRVTGKSGKTLAIFPGIYHQPAAGHPVYVRAALLQLERVGLEDFTLDMTGSSAVSPVFFFHNYASWVKNVKVHTIANYAVNCEESLQCEIRHCDLGHRIVIQSSGGGVLFNTVAGSVVEDNILEDVFTLLQINAGSCGNVFAYNLIENPSYPIPGSVNRIIYNGIDTNHGPHNSYNLYEGNISPQLMCDGYFGGESELNVFRNWLHGSNHDSDAVSYTLTLKRFTRNAVLVGNIIGKNGVATGSINYGEPNMGNGNSIGTCQPSAGVFWKDWKATGTLTVRDGDYAGTVTINPPAVALWAGAGFAGQFITLSLPGSAGYQKVYVHSMASGGSVISWTDSTGPVLPTQGTALDVSMQPAGFQELDLDVQATALEKGNYLYGAGGSAGSMSSLSGATMPSSLFRNSKPSWFGSLSWPPFDSTSPNSAQYDNIPAGYRYVHGTEAPGVGVGGDTTPPTSPASLTAVTSGSQVSLTWTASTDNVGVTGYFLERSQGAGATTYAQITTLASTTYSDSGAAASIVYNYRVRAVDAAGNLSGYSNVATVNKSGVLLKSPTGLKVVP